MFEKAGKEGEKTEKGLFVGGKGVLPPSCYLGRQFSVTEKQCGDVSFSMMGIRVQVLPPLPNFSHILVSAHLPTPYSMTQFQLGQWAIKVH